MKVKLNGTLEEQVAKAHEIIGDVASGLRTFKKSIPAGRLINEKRCGDEDLYLGRVIDNQQAVIEYLLNVAEEWGMIDNGMGHIGISKEEWLKKAMESIGD